MKHRLLLLCSFAATLLCAQVRIIPFLYVKSNKEVVGKEGWVVPQDITSAPYGIMLLSNIKIRSPQLTLTDYANIKVRLDVSTFGSIKEHSDDVTIELSDDGKDYSPIGTIRHTSSVREVVEFVISEEKTPIYFRVYAPNATGGNGIRVHSIEVIGEQISPPLSPPAEVRTMRVTDTGVLLEWSPSIGADSYEVQLSKIGEDSPEVDRFKEDFILCVGSGGNDGAWAGGVALKNLPTTYAIAGWTTFKANAAKGAVKVGTTDVVGHVMTPPLGISGTAHLTFRAGAWLSDSEATLLHLTLTSGALSQSTVTLTKGEFTQYAVTLTDLSPSSRLTFKGAASTPSRFFLDDISLACEQAPISLPLRASAQLSDLLPNTDYIATLSALDKEGERASAQSITFRTKASPIAFADILPEGGDVTDIISNRMAVNLPAAKYTMNDNVETLPVGSVQMTASFGGPHSELTVGGNALLVVNERMAVDYDMSGCAGQWLFLSLPFDIDFRTSIAFIDTFGAEHQGVAEANLGIRVYDSSSRAAGSNSNWWYLDGRTTPSAPLHASLPEGGTVIAGGRGFIFYLTPSTPTTVRFTSVASTSVGSEATMKLPFYGTEGAADAGWQLMGHPLPTASLYAEGMPNYLYSFNYHRGGYDVSPKEEVTTHPFVGYFVQLGSKADSHILFSASSQPPAGQPYRVKEEKQVNRLQISLNRNNERWDNTVLLLDPDASDSFVHNEDAIKLIHGSESRIWSQAEGLNFAYNRFPPSPAQEMNITLCTYTDTSGLYTIPPITLPTGYHAAYLQRQGEGIRTDITQSSYPVPNGTTAFTLTLVRSVPTSSPLLSSYPKVTGADGAVLLHVTTSTFIWVYNSVGQSCLTQAVDAGSYTFFLPRGIYYVRVNNKTTPVVVK